jgi:hypothetical protein
MMMFCGRHVICEPGSVPPTFRVGPRALVLPYDEALALATGDSTTQQRIIGEIRDWELSRVPNG